jgi:hypothetical protein
MSTKKPTPKGNKTQAGKQKRGSNNLSKFFYLVMLLLILTSSFVRISGSNRRKNSASQTATPASLASGTGTAARLLVFHDENASSGTCEDLVIDTNGNAVYSNCGQGIEKQYALDNSEQTLLASWVQYYQPINYDHTDPATSGNVTIQLYLNGQGSHLAGDSATQQLSEFAKTLAGKIASKS